MSHSEVKTEILKYILDAKYGLLNYVRSDQSPISRTIGSFAPDGENLFFSTGKESSKVREIEKNNRVSFFFEHDNQAPESWKSLLLIGDAEPVSVGSAVYDTAVERLGAKSPRFRERIAKGDLANAVIYRIKTSELEYLNRSNGNTPLQKIAVREL
ncbi:MAG: pyridoxamine 5'-phosphate oxidase family protein [Chlorobiaceae bacterium]|nr:pyridoxamine 5'-phosphate oxidase family protein [Chlorobiaceae bacterium]